jgi:hypothetical protein
MHCMLGNEPVLLTGRVDRTGSLTPRDDNQGVRGDTYKDGFLG